MLYDYFTKVIETFYFPFFTDKNAHLIHFVGLAYRGRWLLDIAYYLQNLLKQGGNEIPNIRAVLRIPNPSLVS